MRGYKSFHLNLFSLFKWTEKYISSPGPPVRTWNVSWEPVRAAACTWANTRSWREASWAETTPLFSGASDWKLRMNSMVSWKKELLLQKQFLRKCPFVFFLHQNLLRTQNYYWWHIKQLRPPDHVSLPAPAHSGRSFALLAAFCILSRRESHLTWSSSSGLTVTCTATTNLHVVFGDLTGLSLRAFVCYGECQVWRI